MSIELPEFLSETQIFNRRFLIGVFFPTFTEILFLQLILHKEIPTDLNPVLVLAAIAVGISLILERFAGRLIWIGAFCGRHYRNHCKRGISSNYLLSPFRRPIKNDGLAWQFD